MCTPWFINKLAKSQFKVMCKCSYHLNEEGANRRNRFFPPSVSSSSTNPVSSPSSPISQREVSTTFFSSPRGSQVLEPRSTVKDEGPRKSCGSSTRIFLPQLKRGKLKRRVTIGSSSSDSADVDEPDWPAFADEDYIVFCFEEDGAFHVVMEESPRTLTQKLQCEDHGNISCACHLSRRDCLLTNKEIEEEELKSSQLSPKLQQKDTADDINLLEKNKVVIRNESTESMECRNGSVESTDSSRLDWEEQLEDDEANLEVGSISPPHEDDNDEDSGFLDFRRGYLLPNKVVDEEEVFVSPKTELGKKMTIDELLTIENDRFSTGSDQSSGFSESDDKVDNEDQDQPEETEEQVILSGSESRKSSISNQSDSSSSSFEFPVLEWEWSGSPVTWARSGKLHFRKHKSRRPHLRLRCCRV